MSSKRNVSYKCPFCNSRYTRVDLVNHIDEEHQDELPKEFTAFRYVFNYVNKKPINYHGKCTECGGPTTWDENKGRYNRQCDKKSCHDSYVKKFEDNMTRTKGTTRISKTAEGQVKMLANRAISGTYKFSNGKEKTYTGSYELKALEFMDQVMNINPDDLMAPGPILQYSLDGKTHIYITDFYYQPYNLIIEVKDGGDNPNKRNMPEYRAKQIAKENFIIKETDYNYLRLTNNSLNQLLSIFMELKMNMIDDNKERVIRVNESMNINENNSISEEDVDTIDEMMSAMTYSPVVGINQYDAYIINLPQNNVFNSFFGITDSELDSIYAISKDNKISELSKEESNVVKESINVYYNIGDKKKISNIISNCIKEDKEVSVKELYKMISGVDLYDRDQIDFNFESIRIDKPDTSVLEEYIIGNNDFSNIFKSINEVKSLNGCE